MYTIEVPVYHTNDQQDDYYSEDILEVDFHIKINGDWEILTYWLNGMNIDIEELSDGNDLKKLMRNIEEKIEEYMSNDENFEPEFEYDNLD